MPIVPVTWSLLALAARPLLAAQAGKEAEQVNLLEPHAGLMFWTVLIFFVLLFILRQFAFKPITAAVEAREAALEEAIENAKRDREQAAKVLEEHRRQLEAARAEAQRYIAEGRATAESIRNEMLEATRQQQVELVERAKRDIVNERERAIDALRREAVDLALAGASKVIERNLDDAANRKLVESFLSSLTPTSVARGGKR
jgi:F-type H+-transporting ATPase subunit b